MATRHSGLRVRDSDRVDACALLDNARETGELPDAEHARRTAAAMNARTFGDLDSLIGDLQIPANLVDAPLLRPERRNRSRRWAIAGAIVGVGALLGMFTGCVSSSGPLSAREVPIADPTAGPGLGGFLAAYRAAYGDAPIDELTLYPERVSVERPTADPALTEEIDYRNGKFTVSTTPRSGSDKKQFRLEEFDLPKFAALLAGAPQSLHAPQARVSHVIVDVGTGSHFADLGAVASIYVQDAGKTGFLDVTPAGEPLQVFPLDR
ncbi:DUF1707 SHOCT-like domain-containing protein [Nocardia jejuensis]|uniref:DUF1707 SHOCT-like domain-containing protein n=1 Tax=Nocardia jejuensis TaxID=328049 RepID=UPI000833FD17|nr:DUF1707 domain-containing protein [Nocardia jejuensis]